MSHYFGLNRLDEQIEHYVNFDNGIFFEAGANDGENQSNTCHFARDRGWTGVLVEPIPSRFQKCRANRPDAKVFWSALAPPDWPDPFVELTFCDLMTVTDSQETALNRESHVNSGAQFLRGGEAPHKFHAPARTISSILTEAEVERVDLFSLDLEGFEVPALRGLDLDSFDIRHFCIECWINLDQVTALLGERYELVAKISNQDYLFRKRI